MKKLNIILLILFAVPQLFAQSRYADLKVEFTSPETGTTIFSKTNIIFEFKITNQGPDKLLKGDSMLYRAKHSFFAPDVGTYYRLKHDVNIGETFIVKDSLPITTQHTVRQLGLFFSWAPACFSNNPTSPLQWETYEDREKDNNPHLDLVLKGWTVSIEDADALDVDIYPNPTTEQQLFINGLDEKPLSVELYDAHGKKMVSLTPIWKSQQTVLELPITRHGLYFLRIETTNGVIQKRLIHH